MVEETIRYIDELHKALAAKLQSKTGFEFYRHLVVTFLFLFSFLLLFFVFLFILFLFLFLFFVLLLLHHLLILLAYQANLLSLWA